MNRSNWARVSFIAAFISAMGHQGVAQAADDTLGLKMASSVKDRVFVRAGAIHVKVKTKSGETYDVTGPVITKAELEAVARRVSNTDRAYYIRDGLIDRGISATTANTINSNLQQVTNGIPLVITAMKEQGLDALGTPPGITAVAQERLNTVGISIGAYLTDDYTWAVEAYVLAAPLKSSVTARGPSRVRVDGETVEQYARPFGLQGQKIMSTKMLPPTVMFGRYWGGKDAQFRIYTGVAAMYAMFYDTKATEALNTYVGGSNPGDTTVSLKNTFGFGPMLGLKYQFSDSWHLSMNVGHVKLRTQGTLTTRNTLLTQDSGAWQDFGFSDFQYDGDGNKLPGNDVASISDAIQTGQTALVDEASSQMIKNAYIASGGVVGVVSTGVAKLRGQANLGTYVRKADTELGATMFMLSIGRSF